MKSLLNSLLQMAGIVFFRFRVIPRLWCIWLVGVNAVCLLFLQHLEVQVLFATTIVAVFLMVLIHRRTGFTRLLGATHFLWLPVFAWMATRIDDIGGYPDLKLWLAVVVATNILSCIIDAIDVTRFVRGERTPHYHWA